MRNYDAWLTTDRTAEEALRRVNTEAAAWEEHCFLHPDLDEGAMDPQHPLHAEQYEPWLASYWELIHEQDWRT